MTKLLLIITLLLFAINIFGQESFKKKYYIQDTIIFKNGEKIYLQKDSIINYVNLTDTEKKELRNEYPLGMSISVTKEVKLGENKVLINNDIVVDDTFYIGLSKTVTINVIDNSIKGFVKFDEDGKLTVNRYLQKDSLGNYTRFSTYYYKLKNRQSIQLCFTEFTVSALTIPIKYRFNGKNDLSEDFSTVINGNVFVGFSLGKTSFFHQEKVGNKSNTWKFTGGLLFGASTVTLDKSNTTKANLPILDEKKIIKGLGSLGIGATFAFNKINFGAFLGYDYAIGEDSNKWNYNKKPWVGIAIGYSLINF